MDDKEFLVYRAIFTLLSLFFRCCLPLAITQKTHPHPHPQ